MTTPIQRYSGSDTGGILNGASPTMSPQSNASATPLPPRISRSPLKSARCGWRWRGCGRCQRTNSSWTC